jgi:hypothetical protein
MGKRIDCLDHTTHLPCDVQLVISHKVRVVALEGVQDQSLVSLRDLCLGEPALVSQVQLGRDRPRDQTGRLGVELHVDGLGGLDSDDELITGNVVKDAGGDVLVLDSDLHLGFVEGYASRSRQTGSAFRSESPIHPTKRRSPFPAFMMNGTPSHLGLLIHKVNAANVGQTEPLGTVSSSRYPGLPSAPTYCPSKVSSLAIEGMHRRTLTFSSRTSSDENETGRSIVNSERVCSKSIDGEKRRHQRDDLQRLGNQCPTHGSGKRHE